MLSKRLIIRNLLFLLIGGGLFQLLNSISMLVTARALGSDLYGTYAASFVLTRALAVFYNWGIDTYLLRKGQLAGREIGTLLYTSVVFRVLSATLWLGIISLVYTQLDHSRYPSQLFFIAAFSVIFDGLFLNLSTLLKSNLRNDIALVFTAFFSLTLFAGTIWIIIYSVKSLEIFAWLRLLVPVIVFILLFIVTTKIYVLKFQTAVLKDIISNLLFFAFSDGLAVIYQSFDIIIITNTIGTKMAGLYYPASLIISSLYIIPQAMMNLSVPILSRFFSERDFSKKTLLRIVLLFAIVGLILWLIVGISAIPVINFFLGEQYSLTGQVLLLLSPIIFLKSISFSLVSIIIAADLRYLRVFCQLMAALVNISLNYLVVFRLGILGVSVVFVISETLLAISYFYVVYSWFNSKNRRSDE